MSVISTPAALIGLFNLYASRGRNLLRDLRDEPGIPLTGSDILTLSGLVEKAKDLPDYAYWLNLVITALVGRNSYLQARLVLDRETPFLPVEHRAAKLLERLLVERDKEVEARKAAAEGGEASPRKPQLLIPTATSGHPYTAAWADPEARGGCGESRRSMDKPGITQSCGESRRSSLMKTLTQPSCGEAPRCHQPSHPAAARILANSAALPTALASPTRV